MKRFAIVLLAATLLAGCGGAKPAETKQVGKPETKQELSPAESKDAAAARAVVLRFFNAAATGDGKAMADCHKASDHAKQLIIAMAPQGKLMIEFRRKMIATYGKDCFGELGAAIKDPQQVEKDLDIILAGDTAMADTGDRGMLKLVKVGDAWLIHDPSLMRLSPAQVEMLAKSAPATEAVVHDVTAMIGKPGQSAKAIIAAFQNGLILAAQGAMDGAPPSSPTLMPAK